MSGTIGAQQKKNEYHGFEAGAAPPSSLGMTPAATPWRSWETQ
jgi:hypothetical protein